jgi:hypothetical protein
MKLARSRQSAMGVSACPHPEKLADWFWDFAALTRQLVRVDFFGGVGERSRIGVMESNAKTRKRIS